MSAHRYRLVASARIGHSYFADGLARGLRFSPDAPTQLALHAHQLLLRCHGHGLAVHGTETSLAGLWSAAAPQALRFALHFSDPADALLTEAGDLPTLVLPLFATQPQDETQWRAGLGAEVRLQLQARRTVWKYLLLGDWQTQRPQLLDPRAEVEFEPAVSEALPDGRQALAIRSRSALALAEHSPHRFQLRDAASQPPRLLMPLLPVAGPRGLQREAGQTITEIFVSR